VFKDVGMPHVLLELQGVQRCLPSDDHGACELERFDGTGSQTSEEYERTVYDLANFMAYMAEPAALERQRIGVFVMLFLGFFFAFAWLLNREYWKDVH
jgi:ubiquinol-cytochrome c reductase cytochrome b subunit